jgi:hypothetical protein
MEETTAAQHRRAKGQGALKKTNDGPLRGWLVPQRPKKYQGWSDVCSRFFLIVFSNSPHRETPKNVLKKKVKKKYFGVGWFLESRKLIKYTQGSVIFFVECPSCAGPAPPWPGALCSKPVGLLLALLSGTGPPSPSPLTARGLSAAPDT